MKNNTAERVVKVLGFFWKKSFQLHSVDKHGNVVLTKKLTRAKLKVFVAQLPVCLIGIEACGGANYWIIRFENYS